MYEFIVFDVDVPEDALIGRPIYNVLANDADSNDHQHGQLVYSITNGNTGDAFYIDRESGTIEVRIIVCLCHGKCHCKKNCIVNS